MKALRIIGIVAVIALVLLAVTLMTTPPRKHVEKSIVINAQPEAVFNEVNNLRNFNTWSPWAKMDPQAKYTFDGPVSGEGARMTWDGPKIGKGSQEITISGKNLLVRNTLKFDGFPGEYFSEMKFTPVLEGTRVTWAYESDLTTAGSMGTAMGKIASIVMNGSMEEQYNEGLQNLKKIVESKTKAINKVDVPPTYEQ